MVPELHSVLSLLEGGFSRIKILVIGDIMLDRYIVGDVERISPEAPVPVLRHVHRYHRPGGAANVAMNLQGLGCQVMLAGFWGDDLEQRELATLMNQAGVDTRAVQRCSLPTISKTRIVGRTQQMLRLDIESRDAPAPQEHEALLQQALAEVGASDAVVLSDYAKGALSEPLCHALIRAARAHGKPVLVDPKTRDFGKYAGATTVCPNLGELAVATGVDSHRTTDLLAAGSRLITAHGFDSLVVTMSEKGISVLRPGEPVYHSPAVAREVFDVSGAGDTVIATLAASLAACVPIESAVELANVAAGIVVGKVGTVAVARHELISELMPSTGYSTSEKVLDLPRLRERIANWRASGETIVFTNGCFDILHVGHITLLEECRRFGSKVVLGLNSDSSIRRLKGPSRPVVGEQERARVMAALAAVDAVTLFEQETPLNLIRALEPDVLVKGGDYSVETVVGHEDVLARGGRIEIVPTVKGFSTSNIVEKMKN
jgi:D-beta-D-heptose 7-phosphate kinase/D-beta-D-heptose 1-phosphate adenosyltransferase